MLKNQRRMMTGNSLCSKIHKLFGKCFTAVLIVTILPYANFIANFAANAKPALFFPNLERCELLDLTHALGEANPVVPVHKRFRFTARNKGAFGTKNQWYWRGNTFEMGEHVGTHMDAGMHFTGQGTIDQVEVENFIGEACVLNLTKQAFANPDYEVSIDDLERWEAENGRISSDCILLFAFGWHTKWTHESEFLGIDGDDPRKFHFPGLSGVAAEWLVLNRDIKAVGTDTISIDRGLSINFDSHRVLLAREIPIIENLKDISQLPARGATLVVLPLKILQGTGAPVRAFAFGWNGEADACRREVIKHFGGFEKMEL